VRNDDDRDLIGAASRLRRLAGVTLSVVEAVVRDAAASITLVMPRGLHLRKDPPLVASLLSSLTFWSGRNGVKSRRNAKPAIPEPQPGQRKRS